ncbi:serpin family protein [Nostoc sp. TCL26-01]|uniref:serpin family protein n=1 Tax=Nostoc sp. TCL26-01 TaxID=2576904 RepID=UPI0015BC8999|nr:serpin family protein [Nostoc sp. TCL26-01]QLE57692.1 serpin family protein [Nostoc sp. TCL26-01]
MIQQKFSGVRESFLQRRYAVSLGRRYVLAAASVVLLGVIGCSQVNGNSSAIAQPSLSQTDSPLQKKTVMPDTKFVDANNRFGFKLFSEIGLQNTPPTKNIFVSPMSIGTALAIAYNGASGSTQQAMAKTLEFQGISLPEINSNYAALNKLLSNPDANVQLNIANSLWVNQDISLRPDFIQITRDFYQAKVANIDFQNVTSVNTINDWVKDNTGGKINKIVKQIAPNEVLFLINAIYFKGKWSQEFAKSQTTTQPFYSVSGQQKQHPMMSQTGDYRYYENDQFQAVSLPYGQDGRVSLYVFLPKQKSNLQVFQQNLNAENWEKWMSQFNKRKGSIKLPRFQTDYEITLNDALKTLGMAEAFTNKADFSGIGKNIAISEVKHKAFVEVNEEGTEASAATSVGFRATFARQPQTPFKMIVDRPFFCAIRDNQTKSILFMGAIVEP